jgi:mannose-6-phosphate isomerase-like protein (cupin superfamily)
MALDDPACAAGLAELRPNDQTSAPWHYWNQELFYVLQGEMELEWSTPPMFNDHHKTVVCAGDLILVRLGMNVKPRVLGSDPVRFVWVTMPRPRYFGNESFWGATNP